MVTLLPISNWIWQNGECPNRACRFWWPGVSVGFTTPGLTAQQGSHTYNRRPNARCHKHSDRGTLGGSGETWDLAKKTEEQEETDSRGRGTDLCKSMWRVGMVSMGDRWLVCTMDRRIVSHLVWMPPWPLELDVEAKRSHVGHSWLAFL